MSEPAATAPGASGEQSAMAMWVTVLREPSSPMRTYAHYLMTSMPSRADGFHAAA